MTQGRDTRTNTASPLPVPTRTKSTACPRARTLPIAPKSHGRIKNIFNAGIFHPERSCKMDYFLQNAATGHFQHGETPSVQHPGGALALPGGSPVCLAGVSTQITLLPEQAAGRAESVWMLPWHLLVLGIRWADLPPAELTGMTSLTQMPITTNVFIIISTNCNFIFRNISHGHREEPWDALAHLHRLHTSSLGLVF